MLVIRRSQMEAFALASMRPFEIALVDYLRRTWPRECNLVGDVPQLLEVVRTIVPIAQGLGFNTSHELKLFALMVFSLGIGLRSDPQVVWAELGLRQVGIADSTARIEAVYAEMVDYLGQIGGSDSQVVVRALIRVRRYDFQQPLSHDMDDRIAHICDVLEGFWPEKFAFQEFAPTQRMVQAAVKHAERYGVGGPLGETLFATLGFFFGHAFDCDPLHPWAATALRDFPPGESRALALLKASFARLDASLIST